MKIQNRKRIYTLLYTNSFFSLGFIIGYGNFPVIIFSIFYWSWLITTLLGIIIGRKIEKVIKMNNMYCKYFPYCKRAHHKRELCQFKFLSCSVYRRYIYIENLTKRKSE